ERAGAKSRSAASVRAEPNEVVEVEEEVMGADFHRGGLAAVLSPPYELRAAWAGDVDDLDADPGLCGEKQGAVHGLLLDEWRPGFVVRQGIVPSFGLHPGEAGLEQRVVLGVHEYEAPDRLDLAHPGEELGIRDVRIRGLRERHERLETDRP